MTHDDHLRAMTGQKPVHGGGRWMCLVRCNRGHVQVALPDMDSYGLCAAPMWGRRRVRQCDEPLEVVEGWTVWPPPRGLLL